MPTDTDEFDMASAVQALGEGLDGLGGHEEVDDLEGIPNVEEGESKSPAAAPADAAATPAEGAAPAEASPWTPPEEHKHLFDESGKLRSWSPAAAEQFKSLPTEIQTEVLKREEDILRGLGSYKEAADFGQGIRKVMEPYAPMMQQLGVDPAAQVADLMRAQYTLAFGSPEDKSQMLTRIAQQYHIDLAALGESAAYVDPQVSRLQTQLEGLQSQLLRSQQAQQQASQQEYQRRVETFAADPKNAYFPELANDMAQILRSGMESTLEGAYAKALWMNPAVRAKELARQQTEAQAKAQKDSEAKAAAAKAAKAVDVKSKARGNDASTPLGSMEDTMRETLAAIESRAS